MGAALAFDEPLAGIVVALMYSGGQFLEGYAGRRARREMTALLSRVPRTAHRYMDGGLEEIAIEAIMPGDRLLIRQGDALPVDGIVEQGSAILDQSALTGEVAAGAAHGGRNRDERLRPARARPSISRRRSGRRRAPTPTSFAWSRLRSG